MQITQPGASAADALVSVFAFETRGGKVALPASPAHRLKLHASAPVAGRCGHERFRYTRGDLDFLPAGMGDQWHEDGTSRSVIVELSSSLVGRAAEELGLRPARLALSSRHQFRDLQLEHIAWALHSTQTADAAGGRLYAESLGLALAARLLAGYATAAPAARGLAPATQRRLLAYIDEHIERDLSLFELAEVASMSASHLKAQFKRSVGSSVHAYVMRRRVERAKHMLAAGASITRVALETGFSHPSHMARWMRRVLGVTPRALRPESV